MHDPAPPDTLNKHLAHGALLPPALGGHFLDQRCFWPNIAVVVVAVSVPVHAAGGAHRVAAHRAGDFRRPAAGGLEHDAALAVGAVRAAARRDGAFG
jgi:hypothetical protein